MRTEVLADRARPFLTQIARFGQTITYGQLAALITRPDEPLLDTRAVGKVCGQISASEEVGDVDLTAYVVTRSTGEVGAGWRLFGGGRYRTDSAAEVRLAGTRKLQGRTYDNVRVIAG